MVRGRAPSGPCPQLCLPPAEGSSQWGPFWEEAALRLNAVGSQRRKGPHSPRTFGALTYQNQRPLSPVFEDGQKRVGRAFECWEQCGQAEAAAGVEEGGAGTDAECSWGHGSVGRRLLRRREGQKEAGRPALAPPWDTVFAAPTAPPDSRQVSVPLGQMEPASRLEGVGGGTRLPVAQLCVRRPRLWLPAWHVHREMAPLVAAAAAPEAPARPFVTRRPRASSPPGAHTARVQGTLQGKGLRCLRLVSAFRFPQTRGSGSSVRGTLWEWVPVHVGVSPLSSRLKY